MKIISRIALVLIVLIGLPAPGWGAESKSDPFVKSMNARFADRNLSVEDRPQVRWWLDQGYHTDESLIRSVKNLYDLGYGGMEVLCLTNNTIDKSIYGWGTEEWQHDLKVLVKTAGELGMNVNFAAGPDWQPTFLYYGTNTDVTKHKTWEDYYKDYDVLRKNGRNVLKAAEGDVKYNVYKNDKGVLAIDPNVDVFNQGLGLGYTVPDTPEDAEDGAAVTKTVKYVKAGETVEIDLTNYTYVPSSSGFFAPQMAGGPQGMPQGDEQGGPQGMPQMGQQGVPQGGMPEGGMPGGAPGGGGEPGASGKAVSRANYNLTFANFETISLSKATDITDINNIGEGQGKSLSLEGVAQFKPSQLKVGTPESLITYDAKNGTYTFRWTAPKDDPNAIYALTPSWRVGVGHGTGSDTYDYGYMLMMNHFSTAGADAIFAFWRTYIFTDEMVEMLKKYNMEWDWFIDSLEINRLGNYYWSNEMNEIFYKLNGYDVTPYLPMLFDNSLSIKGTDAEAVRNDMTNAMTEAYIIFQQRLSDNLATIGGKLRAQVSYGAALTTSSAERAVDIPETESLAFKLSVESMKLMSGGAHLSGSNEFSSETTNWIGVANSSYLDQIFAVHLQMAAGVNRTVWHGFEAETSSKKGLSWPNSEVGIGCMFATPNIPTSVLEPNFSGHITRLQDILKTGTETVDIGVMQNDYFAIGLPDSGDKKGLLTMDHTLQNLGYTWECFDSSYLWAEEGKYGFQNKDGTLGHPMYKAIVVWDKDLSLRAAEALLKLVKNGMCVVFLTKDAATTTDSLTGDDAGLARVVRQIKSDSAHVMTIDSTEEIVSALQKMGVTPRLALTDAVSKEPNKAQLNIDGKGTYYTYDGLWTAMMRDKDVNYYYIFNESPDYAISTTASFEGQFTPYIIDTWSGQVSAVAEYRYSEGRTILDLALEPNDVAVYIMEKDAIRSVYITSTDADNAEISDDGAISVMANKTGIYTTELNNGKVVKSEIKAPSVDWDGKWDLNIQSWTKGDVYTVTETRNNTDPYRQELFAVDGSTRHNTVEYGYSTKKAVVFDSVVDNRSITPWKDMFSSGLSKADLTNVSGVGTYTTSFTLPSGWDRTKGIMVDLGSIDCMAGLTVNSIDFKVNIVNPVVDITEALKAGKNEMVVKIATSTSNYETNGRVQTARAFPDSVNSGPDYYKELPSSYGLTGPVKLVPYSMSILKLN